MALCVCLPRGEGGKKINQCESYLVNSQVLVTEQCKVKLKAQETGKGEELEDKEGQRRWE